MCKVNYISRTSYVRNYLYCRLGPEGLLCDAERDPLATLSFGLRLKSQTKLRSETKV